MEIKLNINSCVECPFYTSNLFYNDYTCSKTGVSFSKLTQGFNIKNCVFGPSDFCPYKKFIGIGIAGKAHAGKSYLASELSRLLKVPTTILKFADPLYFYTQTIEKTKDRLFLIELADLTKKFYGDNIFVDVMKNKIQRYKSHKFIIIDDIRYENEVQMLKKENFFIIYLNTPDEVRRERAIKLGMPFITDHSSEANVEAVSKYANVVITDVVYDITEILRKVNWAWGDLIDDNVDI